MPGTDRKELRDHFAGQAMNAMISGMGRLQNTETYQFGFIAEQAYILADAMVEASEKLEARDSILKGKTQIRSRPKG